MTMSLLSANLGVGVGYRREFERCLTGTSSVQWLEVIAEHFMGPSRTALVDRLLADFGALSMVCHGLEHSIAYRDSLQAEREPDLRLLCDRLRSPWYSDHLCFTRLGLYAFGMLVPMHRSAEAVQRVRRNARATARALGRPVLLENVAYICDPGGELDELSFLLEVLDEPDVGLLLDIANLHNNALNHGYDPYAFLSSLPLGKIAQVHLAGGTHDGHLWRDTHSSRVLESVWDLFTFLVQDLGCRPAVLIEWDADFPADPASTLLADVDRAREILG